MREVLSIPDSMQVPMVLGIGYPQASPPEKKRPDLEEIVHWERYALGDSYNI